MSECILCSIVDGKVPSKKIYEDEKVVVVLDMNGAAIGHCFVIPKKHYTIVEQVPDFEVGYFFNIANKISSALFESLNIQGTNIYVENGVSAGQKVPHLMIHVIPRNEKDGIDLTWKPKQLDEEEMSTVELKLKSETENLESSIQTQAPTKEVKKEKKEFISEDDDEEDYRIKQLRNIP